MQNLNNLDIIILIVIGISAPNKFIIPSVAAIAALKRTIKEHIFRREAEELFMESIRVPL